MVLKEIVSGEISFTGFRHFRPMKFTQDVQNHFWSYPIPGSENLYELKASLNQHPSYGGIYAEMTHFVNHTITTKSKSKYSTLNIDSVNTVTELSNITNLA